MGNCMAQPLRGLVLLPLIAGLPGLALAQTPSAAPQTPRVRVEAPTRDPNTAGYVKAKELPDGEIPTPKQDGDFVIGPTHHPAPEMSAREGVPQGRILEFTMESTDSRLYPGIAREPAGQPPIDPADPSKLIINSHSAPYTRKVAVYIPKQYAEGPSRHSSLAPMGRIERCLSRSTT